MSCLAVFMMTACDKAPKGDTAKITDKEQAVAATGKSFMVDTAQSYIKFTGYGVGKNHPGTFKLSYGTVAVEHDSISGGTFLINIKSMKMEQQGEMIKNKLSPHLLSGDFLDAEKFGIGKFEITNIAPYTPEEGNKSLVDGANFYVSGNLTLKDVTKNISFPARVNLDGETLRAIANFDIDRSQWQINYGNDKTLGDKFISEKVNIQLNISARQQEAI
jgi:polyisoprenoid-binding protein YceI